MRGQKLVAVRYYLPNGKKEGERRFSIRRDFFRANECSLWEKEGKKNEREKRENRVTSLTSPREFRRKKRAAENKSVDGAVKTRLYPIVAH